MLSEQSRLYRAKMKSTPEALALYLERNNNVSSALVLLTHQVPSEASTEESHCAGASPAKARPQDVEVDLCAARRPGSIATPQAPSRLVELSTKVNHV